MNSRYRLLSIGLLMALTSSSAYAAGELNIYNWAGYTSPELIKKFEETYDVKVSISEYVSSDEALAKVRQGGHGFDIVVPGSDTLPIWIEEGLLEETNPGGMPNFRNVRAEWTNPSFDPQRKFSAPWTWGTTGVMVNTAIYAGDPNTSAIFLDPPPELVGKINVLPEMSDVVRLAILYLGGKPCTEDLGVLKKVRDKLLEAKPKWRSLDYLSADSIAKGDAAAGVNWNGDTFRARLQNKDIVYGYPKEGFNVWSTHVVVLKDAKNVANAKLFQDFAMDPQNAALISTFTRNANAIQGSDEYLPDEMRSAPEFVIPEKFADKGSIMERCSPKAQELYSRIWTDVMK